MSWVTLTAYAARLGLHRATVQRWCREGRIRARRTPGGHWRVWDAQPLPLTVREAAAELSLSERTIRAWCRSGRLRARQLSTGSEWLIEASEVGAMVPVDNEGGSR